MLDSTSINFIFAICYLNNIHISWIFSEPNVWAQGRAAKRPLEPFVYARHGHELMR